MHKRVLLLLLLLLQSAELGLCAALLARRCEMVSHRDPEREHEDARRQVRCLAQLAWLTLWLTLVLGCRIAYTSGEEEELKLDEIIKEGHMSLCVS